MPTTAPIKVPVRDFVHPDTGGRVTVHGMLHAAQESFYTQLRQTLRALHEQGTRIHLEGVRRPAPAELEAATEELREHAQTLMTALDLDNGHLTSVGLVLQRDHLTLESGWEGHDISVLRAVQVYGPSVMRQFAASMSGSKEMLDGYTLDVLRAFLFQTLATHIKVAMGQADIEVTFPGVDRLMCALREAIALGAVDVEFAKDPAAEVCLVWGAAHLRGFTVGLLDRGFEEKETTWVTAIDPETLPALT